MLNTTEETAKNTLFVLHRSFGGRWRMFAGREGDTLYEVRMGTTNIVLHVYDELAMTSYELDQHVARCEACAAELAAARSSGRRCPP